MSKYPYSLRNFTALAERESRRGKDISHVVPSTKRTVAALRELREAYKLEIKDLTLDSPERLAARERYQEKRLDLRKSLDSVLEESLQNALNHFQSALSNRSFEWGLENGVLLGERQTYRISSSLDVVFPGREAATILREASGTHMVGRNSIVRALKHSLMKRYAHAVYRLDIRSFFDSIPHKKLLNRIAEVRSLDRITGELVERLLHEYQLLKGEPIGIPQGVGVSSPLAELYLSDFDRAIRSFPGVLFYARYVDDIIVVLEGEEACNQVASKIDLLLSELDLEVNKSDDKFAKIVADSNGDYLEDESVEYLGYKFIRSNGRLVIGLTDRRSKRRKNRLNTAFEHWLSKNPTRKTANSGDEGILVDRVRFLAGNTSLKNSKDNVAVGIYFSNSSLDSDAQELKDLDELLSNLIKTNRSRMSPLLLKRLRAVSFVRSFRERTFIRFRQKRLEQVVQCWKAEQS
ncbi:RNA-directed DNA polymerase [Glutamicibacter ectropisis]|uniref:RNA-directed DNA polymerase n=1 Tax=Glutamicibacter ectropisis TaxID=3046593 RepID=A0AAU6WFM9_9MICC